MTKSVFAGRAGLQQYFPNWDKHDLCDLALTIVSIICKLNMLGIRFGCVNPASIYVESSTSVFFVDLDEIQIEGFPVLSQNLTFTLPERIDKPKTPYLFTEDEENYQIALLVFMIMMPGRFPYAKRKSRSETDSIRDMFFPFGIGEMRRSQDSERPCGIWQIVWDHLPYNLCNNFYNTFTKKVLMHFLEPGLRDMNGGRWCRLLVSTCRNPKIKNHYNCSLKHLGMMENAFSFGVVFVGKNILSSTF